MNHEIKNKYFQLITPSVLEQREKTAEYLLHFDIRYTHIAFDIWPSSVKCQRDFGARSSNYVIWFLRKKMETLTVGKCV